MLFLRPFHECVDVSPIFLIGFNFEYYIQYITVFCNRFQTEYVLLFFLDVFEWHVNSEDTILDFFLHWGRI